MTTRERFLKIMRYEKADALPVFSVDPWERDTIKSWRTQGLPQSQQPEEFLQIGTRHILPVFFMPYPPFGRKVLSEDDTYRVETTDMGATVKRRKDFPSMYYGYTDHPVTSAGDWRECIPRSPLRTGVLRWHWWKQSAHWVDILGNPTPDFPASHPMLPGFAARFLRHRRLQSFSGRRSSRQREHARDGTRLCDRRRGKTGLSITGQPF